MKKSMFLVLVVISLFCTNVLAQTYYTDFSLSENPISEGGNWINGETTGRDWTNVLTTGGHARSVRLTTSYDDATALLTGTWGADQTVEGTVYLSRMPSGGTAEIELRLRSSLSTGICTGYEILFSVYGSHQIVRWNGPLGDFDYLKEDGGFVGGYNLHNGDKIKAVISGNIITTYIDFGDGYIQQASVDITSIGGTVFSSGQPGMGFNGDEYKLYGLSDFMATGSGSQPPPPPGDYTLTVQKFGTGTGTVTSRPAGNTCGSTCSSSYGSYAGGTVVKLSETSDKNSSFSGWSGACSGKGPCSVTMDAAKTVGATFVLK